MSEARPAGAKDSLAQGREVFDKSLAALAAVRDRLGTGRAVETADGSHLGERVAGTDHVQDVLLTAARLEHADQARADHENTGARLSLAKDEPALVETANLGHRHKPAETRLGKSIEELAVAQDLDDVRLHWETSRRGSCFTARTRRVKREG